jgi:hypothetical protein
MQAEAFVFSSFGLGLALALELELDLELELAPLTRSLGSRRLGLFAASAYDLR